MGNSVYFAAYTDKQRYLVESVLPYEFMVCLENTNEQSVQW